MVLRGKWDGYRALLLKDGTRLISRNLKDLTADYALIAAAAPRLTTKPVMLDGEIVALDQEGRPAFQAVRHRSLKPAAVVFYAFDILQFGTIDYRSRPLRRRPRYIRSAELAAPILAVGALPGTSSPRHVD